MRLFLVPCNAMANGNYVAEDRGLIEIHESTSNGGQHNRMKLRILLSYHYYKDTDLDALFSKYFTEPYPDVFVDSGGFSAMTQGVTIDIKQYADWVKRYRHLISTYANLDNIKSADETLSNQKRLEDYGLNPIPVFHTGEDWEVLERYVEHYPYIALGGMVPYMRYTKKIMPFIIKAFKTAGDKSVFHGFGATSWAVIKSFPWYSVDSSSWGAGFRFGQVPLFDASKGRFFTVKLGSRIECGKFAYLIREAGFDPADFWDRERNDRAKICAISALSYIKAEQWLRKRWGEVYIPNNERQAGLKQYLATWPPDITSSEGSQFVGGDIQWDTFKGVNAGLRLHLSDTSNGVNFGDADAGVKTILSDAQYEVGDIRRAASILNPT